MSSKSINIMTCGSVDDGKSTLLGRLFYETGNITDDQSEYLNKLQQIFGQKKDQKHKLKIDYSMLLDGLIDEKKQGITIDIAYKYFRIKNKNFVFIDSPGHIEYTKNMAHAASHSNVALVIIDSSKKLSNQAKNHLKIISVFPNIKKIIVCINKLDKVFYKKEKYESIVNDVIKFAKLNDILIDNFVPISGLLGDNVIKKSPKIKFYNGKSLLDILLEIKLEQEKKSNHYYLRIQNILKLSDERVYLVNHRGKRMKIGDKLVNPRTGEETKVNKIFSNFKEVEFAKNKNISVSLTKEISITERDILFNNLSVLPTSSFKSQIITSSKKEIFKNKRYLFKFRNFEVKGFISKIADFDSDFIKIINVELESKENIFDYSKIYDLSKFTIIDYYNFDTLGFGYVLKNLDKGTFVRKEDTVFSNISSGKVLWLTGLSGSGKTTLANALASELKNLKINFYILDGDNLRDSINKDLGFTVEDRIENNRRVAHIAKILYDAGIFVIVSTISPNSSSRDFAREIIGKNGFFEAYVKASLETCLDRNPKNLYNNKDKKIKNITGIHQNYEVPLNPELILDTESNSVESLTKLLLDKTVYKNA